MKSDSIDHKQNEGPYGPDIPNYAILNENCRTQQKQNPKLLMKETKPRKPRISKAVLPLVIIFAVLSFTGCSTSRAGQEREAKMLAAIERTRDFLDHSVLPNVPSPYKEALGLLSLAAGAGLTAWNTKQGQRIKTLEEQHQALKAVVQIHTPELKS